MIRKKQIVIIKIRTKVNIKIKFKELKLKNKYSKQNIYSNQKFEDQIWANNDISKFFTTSVKCFPLNFSGKHFPENQAKFFFYWKVFSINQLFYCQTNTS